MINIVLIIVAGILEVGTAFILKAMVDVSSEKDFHLFYKTIILCLIFLVFIYLTNYLKQIFEAIYTKKILLSLKKDIFQKIMGKDVNDFNKINSAEYISNLTNDINIVEKDYFNSIFKMLFNVIRLGVGVVVIIKLNVYIAISVFFMGGLSLLVPIIFTKQISKLNKLYSDKLSLFTTQIKDIFSGFEVIKSFNVKDRVNSEFDKYNYVVEDSKCKLLKKNAIVEILTAMSGFLVFFTALCVGSYLVMKDSMTFGTLIASIQLMNNIVTPVAMISILFNKIKSVKLIEKKFNNMTTDFYENKSLLEKQDFENSIVFDDVSFKYDNYKNVLNNVSFELKKGCKYAVVGTSGSGKTTIIKLLLRYYDEFNGKIIIDGVDTKDIKISSLYKIISIIHQNVFMFDGSIKDNITLFENFDDDKIEDAINLSGLKDYVNSLKDGYSSSVGENGKNVSGGEKQRIAIARSIIRDTQVLILDESTSALDNETGYNIENSLLNIQKLTCIVITHKLIKSLLKQYDGIIVLKNGEVIEYGCFDELIKLKGYFYSLYSINS